jgi:hypothetical protein
MFCPICGNADQKENAYCRHCGTFLPNFDKLSRSVTTPEQQIKISSTFNFLSATASLILTVWLHIFYTGRDGTPVIIYIVIGFLTANFFWQVRAFWRILELKKQFPRRRTEPEFILDEKLFEIALSTAKLLPEAKSSRVVPVSVIAHSSKDLVPKIKSS